MRALSTAMAVAGLTGLLYVRETENAALPSRNQLASISPRQKAVQNINEAFVSMRHYPGTEMVGNISHYMNGSSVGSRKNFTDVKFRCRKRPRFHLKAFGTADKVKLYRHPEIWTAKLS